MSKCKKILIYNIKFICLVTQCVLWFVSFCVYVSLQGRLCVQLFFTHACIIFHTRHLQSSLHPESTKFKNYGNHRKDDYYMLNTQHEDLIMS